jgi:hypothetical protein
MNVYEATSLPESLENEKIFLSPPRTKQLFRNRPAYGMVTVLTELHLYKLLLINLQLF